MGGGPLSDLLVTEVKTYDANFESLLGSREGKFVVIHGDKVLEAFDSQFDAITWAYRELGNVPFLVKQVLKLDVPMSFVSNLMGV